MRIRFLLAITLVGMVYIPGTKLGVKGAASLVRVKQEVFHRPGEAQLDFGYRLAKDVSSKKGTMTILMLLKGINHLDNPYINAPI